MNIDFLRVIECFAVMSCLLGDIRPMGVLQAILHSAVNGVDAASVVAWGQWRDDCPHSFWRPLKDP